VALVALAVLVAYMVLTVLYLAVLTLALAVVLG
jgi:hypothetical protein